MITESFGVSRPTTSNLGNLARCVLIRARRTALAERDRQRSAWYHAIDGPAAGQGARDLAQFWLTGQLALDLYKASHDEEELRELERIEPVARRPSD